MNDTIFDDSLRALLDRQATKQGDRVFLIDPDAPRTITYRQALEAARSVANVLARRQIPAGSSVGFAMTNGYQAALVLLGIFYAGYRATAINLVSGSETINYVLTHSEAECVFVQPETQPLLGDFPESSCIAVDDDLFADTDDIALAPLDLQHDGLLMYTSGTTGRPKGVRLSHRSLIAGAANTCTAHALSAPDRALCVLPLYHINGLCVTLLAPLLSGGSVVMPKKFSTSGFWPWIRTQACTWFSVVPTQISYLLHDTQQDVAPCPTLRFGRSASAPLAPDVQRAFETRFCVPIIETMGLTETAAQILSNPLPPGTRKIGSPGIAVGNQVMISDAQGQPCRAGEIGEIRVFGRNVMSGYLYNPDATKEALSDDGWLCTGDLGFMDNEGYVFVTGRLKELIIKGGENIAPREIDEALYSHSDVLEAAAFACPCTHYGQRVEAGVVLTPGASTSAQALVEHCREKVGRFKAPDQIHLLEELPKGPSGKVQRMKLANILLQE